MKLPGPVAPASVGATVERIKGWLAAPFTTPLDIQTTSLIVVVVLTVAYLWSRVLRHVFGER